MTSATKTTSDPATATEHLIPETAPELQRGPQWLRQRRHESREAFNGTPVPARGLHLWRYTDPAPFLVDRNGMADTAYGETYDLVEKQLLNDVKQDHIAALATDLGGREVAFWGAEKLSSKGVIISRLSDAVRQYGDLVEPHLYQLVNHGTGKFEALNGALWNDGIFMYVPAEVRLDRPVHVLRESGLVNSAQFPRLLVVTGDNAEMTLIDEYGGGSGDLAAGASYSNAVVEIIAGRHSRTNYVALQRQASAHNSYLTHRARLDEGASMITVSLGFGAAIAKHNYGVILNGRHAESTMHGLVFGSEHQHFDIHTLHHHAAGETTSNIDYKVVLRDRSLSAYTGLIRIEHHAKNCLAYQENRNLLLNRGTRAETIPELEILNEDVSCSHGATIGPIDPMEIFYLQSRGIDRERAIRMIVGGFVESTLRSLPEELRHRIGDFVSHRLENI